MSDRVEKAVVALVALYLTHQKNSVQNKTRDQQQEKKNPNNQQDHAAPVNDYPRNSERNRHRNQARAKSDGKNDRVSASGDAHPKGLSQSIAALKGKGATEVAPRGWQTNRRARGRPPGGG